MPRHLDGNLDDLHIERAYARIKRKRARYYPEIEARWMANSIDVLKPVGGGSNRAQTAQSLGSVTDETWRQRGGLDTEAPRPRALVARHGRGEGFAFLLVQAV